VPVGSFLLPSQIEPLTEMVKQTGAALLLIDPLMAHLDPSINSWKDESAREAMTPLANLAQEHNLAVIANMHLNKRNEVNALIRLGGSHGGIAGPMRSIFIFAADGDEHERLLMHEKHNLSAKQPTLIYNIEATEIHLDDGTWAEVGRVVLVGEDSKARSFEMIGGTSATEDPSALEQAKTFLEEALADGPVEAKAVTQDARREGISDPTLRRAKVDLGVVSRKEGFTNGKWHWELPAPLVLTYRREGDQGGDRA
jgi:hypothetical protein